jgi:hypothetical protein
MVECYWVGHLSKMLKFSRASKQKEKKFCNEHRCTVQLILWLPYSHLSLTLQFILTNAKNIFPAEFLNGQYKDLMQKINHLQGAGLVLNNS